MDMDFHYYGTFTAAMLAGYDRSDAITIAHAAQYVDDSAPADRLGLSPNRIIKNGEYGIDFQPIPTCEPMTNMLIDDHKYMRHIWVPFHFLPGNYESAVLPDPNWKSRERVYTGPRSNGLRWKYDDRAIWQFKLLCRPQSPLITKMINDVSGPFKLHLAGIRMHVLADSGAHMDFAGTPAWHVNDATGDVWDQTVTPPQKIPYNLTGEWCTPPDPIRYEVWNYLGHGRMGHVPDYPWDAYEYSPKWSSTPILKNNPDEYLRTFKEMVTALRCIRDGSTFDVLKPDPIGEEFLKVIRRILNTKHKYGCNYEKAVQFRCELWIKEMSDGSLGTLSAPPGHYDPDAWLDIVKKGYKTEPIRKMDYYKFNRAAIEHHDFVERYLMMDGMPLDDWPKPA